MAFCLKVFLQKPAERFTVYINLQWINEVYIIYGTYMYVPYIVSHIEIISQKYISSWTWPPTTGVLPSSQWHVSPSGLWPNEAMTKPRWMMAMVLSTKKKTLIATDWSKKLEDTHISHCMLYMNMNTESLAYGYIMIYIHIYILLYFISYTVYIYIHTYIYICVCGYLSRTILDSCLENLNCGASAK